MELLGEMGDSEGVHELCEDTFLETSGAGLEGRKDAAALIPDSSSTTCGRFSDKDPSATQGSDHPSSPDSNNQPNPGLEKKPCNGKLFPEDGCDVKDSAEFGLVARSSKRHASASPPLSPKAQRFLDVFPLPQLPLPQFHFMLRTVVLSKTLSNLLQCQVQHCLL